MKNVFFEGKVLWSQIDANRHLRHSAYADLGAQARLQMMESLGFKPDLLETLKIGPILFREELIYMREVNPGDKVKITCVMTYCRRDGSRWAFSQELFRGDGVKAAQINVQGAWIDMTRRKLTALPKEWSEIFLSLPRSEDFVLEELSDKKTEIHKTNIPMTDLEQKFEDAKKRVMDLPEKPGNEALLELYALNKQATIGDVNVAKPAMFDFVAAAKYNAWTAKKGMAKEDAQMKYIQYVDQLFKK